MVSMVSVTQNYLTPGKRQLPAPSGIDQMGSTVSLSDSLDILETDIKRPCWESNDSSDTHPTATNTPLRPVKNSVQIPIYAYSIKSF